MNVKQTDLRKRFTKQKKNIKEIGKKYIAG